MVLLGYSVSLLTGCRRDAAFYEPMAATLDWSTLGCCQITMHSTRRLSVEQSVEYDRGAELITVRFDPKCPLYSMRPSRHCVLLNFKMRREIGARYSIRCMNSRWERLALFTRLRGLLTK
jgi:hypothetical protein